MIRPIGSAGSGATGGSGRSPPFTVDAVLTAAQRGSGKRASLYTDYTFSVWDESGTLVPFAKAYSGLTDDEIRRVDAWIRRHMVEKFGPVRTVTPELVFELAFEGIQRSSRHKSGIAVRFPRIVRWRDGQETRRRRPAGDDPRPAPDRQPAGLRGPLNGDCGSRQSSGTPPVCSKARNLPDSPRRTATSTPNRSVEESATMLAVTVEPGKAGSARLEEVPEPPIEDGPILVEAMALGVCGTDVEIVGGHYGWAPEGRKRLVLGHESLGRVKEAPDGSGFSPGDLVVGIVRRPDPVPCPNCAVGEWDMCRNEKYTERGIKERDGYGSERFRIHPEYLVKVDPGLGLLGVLLEPASVLAKAWEHIERIGERALWKPRRLLVTGAGPIGLLAALMGAQRGLDVHVLDLVKTGPKPHLVHDLGGHYHTGSIKDVCIDVDIVIECTGVGQLIFEVMDCTAPGGIACLTGVSSGARQMSVDFGALNNTMVLENDVVFGSVNANRRHYEKAAEALAKADRGWLERIVSRRVPLDRWDEALSRQADDVKPIIVFGQS